MPFPKGNIPWNKGLTKKTDERVKRNGENTSKTKRRKFKEGKLIPWNKGLTKDDPRIAKGWKKRRKTDPNNLAYKKLVETRKRNDPLGLSYFGRADKAWKTKRKRYGSSGIEDLKKFKEKCRKITEDWWKNATPEEKEKRTKKAGEKIHEFWENLPLDTRKKRGLKNRKNLEGLQKNPNKIEQRVININQKYNLPFEYTGNKPYPRFDGLYPDFVSTNGSKKILEIFGDYWHRNDNPEDRINVFKELGYGCIVIWEHEIYEKSDEEIAKVISDFLNSD